MEENKVLVEEMNEETTEMVNVEDEVDEVSDDMTIQSLNPDFNVSANMDVIKGVAIGGLAVVAGYGAYKGVKLAAKGAKKAFGWAKGKIDERKAMKNAIKNDLDEFDEDDFEEVDDEVEAEEITIEKES